MDKIPFNEAARLAGIHLNTLRNWQKSGKLKTSEKIIENGRELWIVDPSELNNLSSQHVKRTDTNNVVTIDTNNAPPGEPGPITSPALEQTLVFMRESVVRPLVEANERQAAVIGELREEIGSLKERLRALEAATATPQPAPEPQPIMPVTISPVPEIAVEPVKRGFWQRLFGG